MPWGSNRELPSRVKKHARSAIKQRAFRHAFESAKKHYEDEGTAWAVAYTAAKKAGKGKKKKIAKSFREYCEDL